MTSAFLYLAARSAQNQWRVRLARLREPRYALGLLLGAAYLFLVFGRSFTRSTAMQARGADVFLRYRDPLEVGGALLVLVVAILAWVFSGSSRPALAFTTAEVQFLFPAPVTRRQLIRYKVIRSQLGAAVGSLVFTVLTHIGRAGSAWLFFFGVWFVMVTFNLHMTGISLRRQSLLDHGLAGMRREWLPLTVILAGVAALVWVAHAAWPALAASAGPAALAAAIGRLGHTGLAGVVLWPFLVLVRLPLSATAGEFLRGVPAAGLVLAANYVWVVRSDAAFEEASAAYAERAAASKALRRAPSAVAGSRKRQPFALGATGRPETAFLWKNLILVGRYVSPRTFLRLALPFAVIGLLVARRSHGAAAALGSLSLLFFVITLAVGSNWFRNDLRRDLAHLTTLRTWPLTGAQIVRGEVLAPTVMLSAVLWLLIIVAVALSGGVVAGQALSIADRVSYAAAAMIVIPGVILMQVVIQNAAAAAFPAWVDVMGSRSRGVDVLGQRLFVTAGLLIATALAVLPAAIVAALVAYGLRSLAGTVLLVVPAAFALGVLVIEAALAVEAIGAVLDRADIKTMSQS